MSEWFEQQAFTLADTGMVIVTATNGEGTIAPTIGITPDYILRDQDGEAIADEYGNEISVEGLTNA